MESGFLPNDFINARPGKFMFVALSFFFRQIVSSKNAANKTLNICLEPLTK